MTLVGKKAPEFCASAVTGQQITTPFSLDQYRGKYVIFFFYPLDFTFVCPTELHAFQEKLSEFERRGAQVVGCSVDSPYCHLAWLNTPKSKGGIQGVTYPLVADVSKKIAQEFGVLIAEQGVAYRGLFLIDKTGVVRHQVVNDLPLGRSIEEALRMLDALIYFETHGEVCPADWNQGKKTMKPNQKDLEKYFSGV
jgi:peroxiredoxin (alkyl hydroperoxide reductase subunit C)